MFENIGEKIKGLAKVICVIGIVFSVIYGLDIMMEGKDFVMTGLITAIVGSVISWISSFFTYGFGTLISNSEKIARNIESIDSYSEEMVKRNNQNKESNEKVKEEKKNENAKMTEEKIEIKCPSCGIDLAYNKDFLKDKDKIECPMCKNEIDIK